LKNRPFSGNIERGKGKKEVTHTGEKRCSRARSFTAGVQVIKRKTYAGDYAFMEVGKTMTGKGQTNISEEKQNARRCHRRGWRGPPFFPLGRDQKKKKVNHRRADKRPP